MSVSIALLLLVTGIATGYACYRRGLAAGINLQLRDDTVQYLSTNILATDEPADRNDATIDQPQESTYEVTPSSDYEQPIPDYLELQCMYEKVV